METGSFPQFHISRGSLGYLENQRGSSVEHWKYGTSEN